MKHFTALIINIKYYIKILWFDVERSRKAVHDWVQKTDLQSASKACPDQVALDEAVIRINRHRFWLYEAVDPETHELLHFTFFITMAMELTYLFLRELREKHSVVNTVIFVDHASRCLVSNSTLIANRLPRIGHCRTYPLIDETTDILIQKYFHPYRSSETWLNAFFRL